MKFSEYLKCTDILNSTKTLLPTFLIFLSVAEQSLFGGKSSFSLVFHYVWRYYWNPNEVIQSRGQTAVDGFTCS